MTHKEVLRILLSIGPTEAMHFQTWHDKAGNARPLTDPTNGLVFPDLNKPPFGGEESQTNLIMPEPTIFLNRKFPICSIIRSTETEGAAMAALNALTADGLFIGQTPEFFAFLSKLAQAADAARHGGADENDENDRMEAGTHTLTVNKGSGSGRHVAGSLVKVTADMPPAGKQFARWSGDTEILANPFVSTTTATVPSIDVTITATFCRQEVRPGKTPPEHRSVPASLRTARFLLPNQNSSPIGFASSLRLSPSGLSQTFSLASSAFLPRVCRRSLRR